MCVHAVVGESLTWIRSQWTLRGGGGVDVGVVAGCDVCRQPQNFCNATRGLCNCMTEGGVDAAPETVDCIPFSRCRESGTNPAKP
jgi:hypothetical protein